MSSALEEVRSSAPSSSLGLAGAFRCVSRPFLVRSCPSASGGTCQSARPPASSGSRPSRLASHPPNCSGLSADPAAAGLGASTSPRKVALRRLTGSVWVGEREMCCGSRWQLQKDLEEVKVLLEKATRKRVRDALTAEKSKIEIEMKNKMQQKSQRKAELTENEKPAAVVAPITTGYTVKISNYGWDQSDKFVKIYITLPGVHQVPAESVQVNFTERSFDLLVKNLSGKSYSMIVNNLLKPISVEGSSKKVKTDTVLILCRKKAENTRWDYLTQVEKECKEKEKPSYDTETDPSEGLMNVLKKIYEDGDDDMKRTINKAWVESREKQAKGDTDF
uniref:Uncharacterized protein n=1 Tax=Ovis aries TaxID=9940 RepID=A0AC11EB94_SHEEP